LDITIIRQNQEQGEQENDYIVNYDLILNDDNNDMLVVKIMLLSNQKIFLLKPSSKGKQVTRVNESQLTERYSN